MTQIKRTVTAGPRLSTIEDSLHGFRAADPAELANVAGGDWPSLGSIWKTIDRVGAYATGGVVAGFVYDKLHGN
jgi:hypothetical protein